jgi:hypothetical protein
MAVRYSHTQTNRSFGVLFIVLAAVLAATWYMLPSREAVGPGAVGLVVLAILAAAISVFSSLSVEVDDEALTFGFAFGVLRRRVPLADIAAAERITIPWWLGAGVKLSRGAVTYLVAAGPAVAIRLRSGGREIRLGSDDAEALEAALRPRWSGPERRASRG